jgi:sugar phosphate isomerase/epimerase
MNRRNFSKRLITAVSATMIAPGISSGYNPVQKKVRLGGPVFKKYTDPAEWVLALKDLNYRAAYCPVGLDAKPEEISRYRKAAKEADIVIAEVGAWSNPIDPDKTKREAAIEKCIKSLELADEIGANCCVNISGSRNPESWAGPHKDNLTTETFDMIVETTRKIIDAVKPSNTFFALETMPWAYPDSVDSYLKLINAIDRPGFAVHLDPVNLVVSPQVYFRNGEMIREAFNKMGKYIKSCHAKDILLRENELTPHLPEVRAGLGNLDYRVYLECIAKIGDIPLMLEHLNTAAEYDQAAEHIRNVGKLDNIFL